MANLRHISGTTEAMLVHRSSPEQHSTFLSLSSGHRFYGIQPLILGTRSNFEGAEGAASQVTVGFNNKIVDLNRTIIVILDHDSIRAHHPAN